MRIQFLASIRRKPYKHVQIPRAPELTAIVKETEEISQATS